MFLGSERINSDLKLALDFTNTWSQDFVIRYPFVLSLIFFNCFRKFVPVPIEYEFRAFVVNNELRAMCQYYHYLFFPTLVKNKEKINEMVQKKFQEIKDSVPIEDKTYVSHLFFSFLFFLFFE